MLIKVSSRQLQAHAVRGEWDRVAFLCEHLISRGFERQAPNERAECYAMLGRALVHQGNDQKAIAAYTQSLRQQPHQPKSHYAIGLLYGRQKKYSRAISHYQMALQLSPNWAQAAFKLGSVFHQVGYARQARQAYEFAITCDRTCADAYFALGLLHEQKGEVRKAIKCYRETIFLRPKHVRGYCCLSAALIRMDAYEAAADVSAQAVSTLPDSALLHNNLGQILSAKGDTAAAMLAYQQALTLENTLAVTHQNLGRLWRSHQNLDKATEHFQQALQQIALQPQNLHQNGRQQALSQTAILSDYARVLIAQGDWSGLLDCFRQAIALSPDWIAAYCDRTIHLCQDDLFFRLQRTCGRFLLALQQAQSPDTEAILQERLCQIYEYLGDLSIACDAPTRAEQCYRNALSINPDALNIYVELGDCLRLQGRQTAAITIYQAGILQSETFSLTASHATQLLTDKLKQASLTQPAEAHAISGIYSSYKDWLAVVSDKAQAPYIPIAQPDPQCGGVTCGACMGKLIRQFEPVQVGKRAFFTAAKAAPEVPDFPTFVAVIPQGRAWIAPQENAWNICNEIAVFTPDNYLLGNLSRCFPWYLPGCDRHSVSSHTVLHRQAPLPEVRQLKGSVAILSGLSGHIYYHWMFDVLPRLNILREALERQGERLDSIDYFVVNNFEKGFQKETLAALGIPLEKVIASDHLPHIQAERLIVPSFAGHLDWVPPGSIDFLRSAFLQRTPAGLDSTESGPAESQDPSRKRFYITRSQAKYRHVLNEMAVIDLLESFGLIPVALETLSVAQQAQLFAEAEIIVSPHGSGLTNLAFCSPNTTVVECFSPYYMRTDYWTISQHLKINHYYLIGESFECHPLRQLMYPSGLTEDFLIDLSDLRGLLKTILSNADELACLPRSSACSFDSKEALSR